MHKEVSGNQTTDLFLQRPMRNVKAIAMLVASFVFTGLASYAQVTPGEANNAVVSESRLKSGYQTPVKGWVIHEGDTLELGRATGPSKTFAFIYTKPDQLTTSYADGKSFYSYMDPNDYGKRVVVTGLMQSAQRRYFFKVCAALNLDKGMYCADLDNAITAGEILPPARYR